MSRPNRNPAVITAIAVAVIGATATITASLITAYFPKKEPGVNAVQPAKTDSKAETKGDQSPAIVGAKDVTVTYGQPSAKQTGEKPK